MSDSSFDYSGTRNPDGFRIFTVPNGSCIEARAAGTIASRRAEYRHSEDEAEILAAAAISAGSSCPEFTATPYTGGAIKIEDFTAPVVIDLKGLTASAKPRPVLKDFDATLPLGHTESIDIREAAIVVSGCLSGPESLTGPIVDAAANNFPWVSAASFDIQRSQFFPQGSVGLANGQEFPGPVNIARRSVLRSISIGVFSSDPGATFELLEADE